VAAEDDASIRWAAVALIVASGAFLLIRRAERTGDPWSGHLALPGGRTQPTDPDLLATAIRETREEVGIILERTDLDRVLEDVVPRTPSLPPVAVRPFAFALRERPPVVPNPEVASALWVPLDLVAAPAARHELAVTVRGERRLFPAFATPAGPIWGMTERILTSFLGD
jgi:8-oxo-dGTP pyrophosphatase MutT (NUDIX family)